MSKLGLRVVRGPDWSWENEDGGEGHTGTLYDINNSDKTAIVQWDNGNQTSCKTGRMDKYELRIIDNAQIGIVHEGFKCNECIPHSIRRRYKCNICPNYDLCELCYITNEHDLRHSFNRIDSPRSLQLIRGDEQVVVHFGVSCDSCGYVDIRGNRYKCTICYNYDLCETCYNSNKHNLGHGFRRFDSPHSTGTNLMPRIISRRNRQDTLHEDVFCDGCSFTYIYGMRYTCSSCVNYDLCYLCYHGDKHDLSHSFKRIDAPQSMGIILPPRSTSRKCQLRGIFKGAKVAPGIDWGWDTLDKLGVVLGITKWKDQKSWRSAAYVKWIGGDTQLCRLGYNGHCDLQSVKAAPAGIYYYPQHLPILGQTEEQMNLNSILQEIDQSQNTQEEYTIDYQFQFLSLNEAREGAQVAANTSGVNAASDSSTAAGSGERLRQLESKIAEMEQSQTCAICLEARRNVVFLCGHGTCSTCADSLISCHMCRKRIEKKIRIY